MALGVGWSAGMPAISTEAVGGARRREVDLAHGSCDASASVGSGKRIHNHMQVDTTDTHGAAMCGHLGSPLLERYKPVTRLCGHLGVAAKPRVQSRKSDGWPRPPARGKPVCPPASTWLR